MRCADLHTEWVHRLHIRHTHRGMHRPAWRYCLPMSLLRGSDRLSDPGRLLALITINFQERLDEVHVVAPHLQRSTIARSTYAIPGVPTLALLMVAAHAKGGVPHPADLPDIYRRTRRTYAGADSLAAKFRYRQDVLHRYFDEAVRLTEESATELIRGLDADSLLSTEFGRLATSPSHRQRIQRLSDSTGIVAEVVLAHVAAPKLAEEVAAALSRVADQLDTATVYYPPTLTPTALVGSLTVAEMQDGWRAQVRPEKLPGLYGPPKYEPGGPPREALDTFLETAHRASVLLGDPGSGKSTVLAAVAARRIRESRDHPTVFVRLPDLAEVLARPDRLPPKNPTHAVEAAIEAMARWHVHPLAREVRERLRESVIADPQTMLIFDSWDEVSDPALREAVRETLGHLYRLRGRILVATRITGYEQPLPAQAEYILSRMVPIQVDKFFDTWFLHAPGPGRQRIPSAFNMPTGIGNLVTIPLMAGLVAYAAEDDVLPGRKHELMNRCISLFLERRWKPPRQFRSDVHIGHLVDVAACVAWGMATHPTPTSAAPTGLGEWRDTATGRQLTSYAPGRQNDITELIHADGLLTLHGYPSDKTTALSREYRWVHRVFHEHLTAHHFVHTISTDLELGLRYCRSALLRPDWINTLEYVVGLLDTHRQQQVLADIEQFAEEGDPGEWLRTQLDRLRCLAPDTPSAHQRFDSAVEQVNYRLAYQLSPKRLLDIVDAQTDTLQPDQWRAFGELVRIRPPVRLRPAALAKIAEHTISAGVLTQLAETDEDLAHTIATRIIDDPTVEIPWDFPLSKFPPRTLEWILRKMNEEKWTRGIRIAVFLTLFINDFDVPHFTIRFDSEAAERVFRCFDFDNNELVFPLKSRMGDGLLAGEAGPTLAYLSGRWCTPELVETATSLWVHVGFWANGYWANSSELSGEWNESRALAALRAIDDYGSPADADRLVEVSQALRWWYRNPVASAIPDLIDIESKRGLHSGLMNGAYDIDVREAPAAALVHDPSFAARKIPPDQFWRLAEDRIRVLGWQPVLRMHLEWDEIGEVVAIANAVMRTQVPLPSELMRGGGAGETSAIVQPVLDMARATRDAMARRSLVTLAMRYIPKAQLETFWPTLTSILGGDVGLLTADHGLDM